MIEMYTQVECCPELNQKKLTKFCKDRDIVLIAYSPLGHPKENIRHPNFIYDDKVLQIAKKHNKTAPQIVLRFLVSRKTHRNDKYYLPIFNNNNSSNNNTEFIISAYRFVVDSVYKFSCFV